jgi:GNAT superfamily N-acetyltransferase
MAFQIVDLNESYHRPYFMCLEEWSDEIKEAGDRKNHWYNEMKEKGLRVKIAVEDNQAVGMIQYLPVEHAFVEGSGLYFILCIWVHGYKKHGVGNRQKQGIGKALLAAAEEDARMLGAKGIAAWGFMLPFFMRASWFKKHGFKKADRQDMMALLWKPFSNDAIAPKWIKQHKKPQAEPGKVVVTSLVNGWCPAMNLVHERAKRASAEFGDQVIFREINTNNRENYLEWGVSDTVFIDEKALRSGPPLAYDKIYSRIDKRVRKL